jgi:hypothetical protein
VSEPLSSADEQRRYWSILTFLALLAVANTELRVAKIVGYEAAYVSIIAIGLAHLAVTALLIWRTRSTASVLYLLATFAGFILVGGVSPLSALWSVRGLLLA